MRATAVDALQHGYRVVVPREAVGDRDPAAHEQALFDIDAKYGDVLRSRGRWRACAREWGRGRRLSGTGCPKRLTWLRVPARESCRRRCSTCGTTSLEKLGFVPNVLRAFALRPSHLLAWTAHYDELMKGEAELTRAEREMIAVVVSVANDCAYCIAAHSAALRKLTGIPPLRIRSPPTIAPRTHGRMKAALDYSLKLTRTPQLMVEADAQRLRDEGWSDESVMDIAEVAAMFNFSNRLASGLGWLPNPEYAQLGR